jgi:hypothetical protein
VQRVLGQMYPPAATSRAGAFQILLEHVQREEREFSTPYQVVKLGFPEADDVRRRSVRTWEQTRLLLADVLNSALRPVDLVEEQTDSILILMPRTDEVGARQAIEQIRGRVAAVLKIDLKVDFELLDMQRSAA